MENTNIQTNAKKDTKLILRNIIFPLGLSTAIILYVGLIIHTIGAASTNQNFLKTMIEIARFIAIPTLFLSLGVAGLMIAHSVLQIIKIRKENVKDEITTSVFTSIVGLLMFIFFLVLISKVFDIEKWGYYEPQLSTAFSYTYYSYENFAMMGIMEALLVISTVFAKITNRKYQINTQNGKLFRIIGVSTLVMICLAILPISFGTGVGMQNMQSYFASRGFDEYIHSPTRCFWVAGGLTIKFAYGLIGSIIITMLPLIPLSILLAKSKNQQTKSIIMWSLIIGIGIILFSICASTMKIQKEDGYVNFYATKWYTKTIMCSVFAFIGLAIGIAATTLAFVFSKQYVYIEKEDKK